MATTQAVKCDEIRFVKELYPRLKPDDETIERYRDSLEYLPPIVVARDGILVDGYHRWQAHVREKAETIQAENIGNLADAEIVRESIKRNATHGHQLSGKDKQRLAAKLWQNLGHLTIPERIADLTKLLGVTDRRIRSWTDDVRKAEENERKEKAWDMWLDCHSYREIGEAVGKDHKTISDWAGDFRKNFQNSPPPGATEKNPWGNVQHFNIWNFQTANKEDGAQSYFGAIPPQVVENLLWFYTEPGDVVVDLFAGSGTTVDVAKRMGRRVWASDRIGNKYSPNLPIHTHDATTGWPSEAPKKPKLVLLDPPYWQQAENRYSSDPEDLGNMELEAFDAAWGKVARATMDSGAERIAYIISPTFNKDDGSRTDHATSMSRIFTDLGWRIEQRIIVPYQTQQATGAQVEWARKNKRLLTLYRDLVLLSPEML